MSSVLSSRQIGGHLYGILRVRRGGVTRRFQEKMEERWDSREALGKERTESVVQYIMCQHQSPIGMVLL